MAARIKARTKLRNAPDPTAPNPLGMVKLDDMLEILSEHGGGIWLEVRATDLSGNVRTGFVPADRVDREAPDMQIDEEIDPVAFGTVCTNNARTHGVNRDYLIALAWCESRIRNVGTAASSAFGPFQFLQETWRGMVTKHGQDTGITEAAILRWEAQATFAAILIAETIDRILDKLDRLPTATELCLTHILGVEAALHALQKEPGRKIDSVLLEFYRPKKGDQAAAFVDKIITGNAPIFRVDNQVNSTEQVLQALAAKLREGFVKAHEIVLQLPADAQFQPRVAGVAATPWMAVAQAELQRGVFEVTGTGSNPRIEDYHVTTGLGRKSDDTAWCASFVSFCMTNVDNDKVRQANLRSARAADWRNWGEPIDNPVPGAVVVLEPLVSGSTGHVGFVVEAADDFIRMLAGNQRDEHGRESVCIRPFSMDKVVSLRWLDA
jgi:uncharacterized protein (TIGR02594 family)